jgi:plastocyanin
MIKFNIWHVALIGALGLVLTYTAFSATRETPKPLPNQVVIESYAFVPATLTIKAGTKVTFVNRDDVPHTATDVDKRFNSKALDTNDQFAFTFTQPGTYNYFCALHPKMTGTIIVK